MTGRVREPVIADPAGRQICNAATRIAPEVQALMR
jgi:hypothetical protein